jgi:hypothetical protein
MDHGLLIARLSAAILAATTRHEEGRYAVAKPPSPVVFREECERRLIDTFGLMLALGLRSKQGIWNRVEAGTLPPPIYSSANIVALWDRDELELPDTKEATG